MTTVVTAEVEGLTTPVKAPPDSMMRQKATDETLSTTNCDDSMTASFKDRQSPLSTVRRDLFYPQPPVFSVSVEERNVRQRLRDQEAKIAALLHPRPSGATTTVPVTNASEGVLLKLVHRLENDLKKTEAEKALLQEKVDQLQKLQQERPDGDDVSVSSLEEQSHAAVDSSSKKPAPGDEVLAEKIAALQLELRRKTHEILLLQDRWETTLQKMVQYQVDLETHDLHYTDYAAQQLQAGDETLKEFTELTAKDQPPATRQLGKQARHMMSTLLRDLEVLGERYQESRRNQELQLADYKQKHLEWQHRARVLEDTLREHKLALPEDLAAPLVREDKLQLTSKHAPDDDLVAQVEAAKQTSQHAQTERDLLQVEVERLQRTVSRLQSVTAQQQGALEDATAALAAVTPPKKKKKWFSFGKKKQEQRSVVLPSPVDVAVALAPMQVESQRFDRIKQALLSQKQAYESLRRECINQRKQTAQLKTTMTELRLEQHAAVVEKESRALSDLHALFDEVQIRCRKEQAAAQDELQRLRQQLVLADRSIRELV